MPPKILYLRDITSEPSDESIARFLSSIFGERNDQLELIASWRADSDLHASVAVDEDELIGMCVAREQTPAMRETYAQFGIEPESVFGKGRWVIFNMLAVAPSWRRQGVGEHLARALATNLPKPDAVGFVGICWDHGHPGSSKGLFEGAGFSAIGSCVGYYRQFHETSGQECPHCAPKRCVCRALLYVMRPSSPTYSSGRPGAK